MGHLPHVAEDHTITQVPEARAHHGQAGQEVLRREVRRKATCHRGHRGPPHRDGINVAASTVWEILKEHGIPPAPERQSTAWADFLRSQAKALLACDLFEIRTLTGARLYVFAVIEHASRRIRILGVTAHPTAEWIVQLGRNLLMNLEDIGSTARYEYHQHAA
ncbi:hypothetical protein AB0L13_26075 [Saccharopolyspora shandongensis]|uniref:hypothetical protein n=1 Tax=Saccharopolyspora shandongensis TaxID=418495 RepID=UPI003414CBF5